MGIFDSTSTIKFEKEFYVAMGQFTAAVNNLTQVVATQGKAITMKVDEALEAIKQAGDDQAAASNVLLQEVAKVGDAVNALEQQIIDALAGTLTTDQQAKLDAALAAFRANTQAITDAAAAVKAGTDDAGDGTAT